MQIPTKKDLIKISDYIWEIPKSFRDDMKVPARIFASEEMLDDLFKDRSLWQLVNMTTLPGTYKYALAMPDVHEGYGFCLLKGTKILTSLGYYINIEDLEKTYKKSNVLVFDKEKNEIQSSKIIKFFKLKPYTRIFKLTTKAGFEIIATEDHPIFTREGKKEIKFLNLGDEVIVYGFEGVPFEKPSSEVIIDEKDIIKTFQKIKPPKNKSSLEIIIKKLKEKNLLPLTYDHPKLPIIIKVLAFIFGDGSMNFIGKKKDGILYFTGDKEDLMDLKRDLKILGYNSSKIYKSERLTVKNKKVISYSFYVNTSSLLILLASLGAPIGTKVNQKFRVPKWIFKAPLWQKRLFLATLFGCKLRSQNRRKFRKFGFNSPVYPMNKRIDLIENGKEFLQDIAKLCEEFVVKTTKINQRRLIKAKNGNLIITLELVFSSEKDSLLNLWSKIGYEYNRERMSKASIYSVYLRHKKRILEERKMIMENFFQLLNTNLSYAKIATKLENGIFTKRWIEDVWMRLKISLDYTKPKVPQKFISLTEFVKKKALIKSGLVLDEIEKIEEIKTDEFVYDLTVGHSVHNFIANSFVVSNCVGGVLAIDLNEGVVSPGGVGFDINCLHPKAKVNLEHGTYLEIKNLTRDNLVISFDKKNKKLIKAKIALSLSRKAKKLLKIKTKFGYQTLVTEDHPIYTFPIRKKLAKNFKVGDKILIYPFQGVRYERPKKILLLDRSKFEQFLKKNFIIQDATIQRHISFLESKGFLPLYLNSPKLPYLLKLIGYGIGSSTLLFSFLKKKPIKRHYIIFDLYCKDLDALKEIAKDLEVLGINYKVKKIRKVKILKVKDRAFILLLNCLGLPVSKKSESDFRVPRWIFKTPKYYQRLFLASLFGAQSMSLRIPKGLTYNCAFGITLNKKIENLKSGFAFMKDLKKLLNNFDIKVNKIGLIRSGGVEGKSVEIFLRISGERDNLLKFLETINFEYNPNKRAVSLAMAAYFRYKKKVIEYRNQIFKEIRSLKKEGYSYKMIIELFLDKEKFIDKYLIQSALFEKNKKAKLPRNFIPFNLFQKNYFYHDFIIDEIESIKPIIYKGEVYDLTIDDPNHNFIADHFLVSNCGVRLLATPFFHQEIKDKIPKLTEEIFKQVPSGVGRGGFWKLNNDEMNKVLTEGAKWIVEIGYGSKEDLEATESYGKLDGVDPDIVSKTAKDRGRDQLGTIGAGNHFVEVQRVAEVFDEEIAKKLGLEKDKVCVLIHCGSRGLGHQVATDYIREALRYLDKQGIDLVDRELAYLPYSHPIGQDYLSAMRASANFAFANRQLITYEVRKAFKKVFGKEIELKQIYDVAHNIVKIEEYDGRKLLVHRKGATRAFWQGHPDLPNKYQKIGQPTLIPGSMGTSSYILIGQKLAEEISFGSAPHGAGRMMSRAEAKRKVRGSELKKELENRGIAVSAGSMSGLAEEAPIAYKDVSEVVEVVHNIGIAKKLVKLVPLGVIKG